LSQFKYRSNGTTARQKEGRFAQIKTGSGSEVDRVRNLVSQ
jgi:hypothetical protein